MSNIYLRRGVLASSLALALFAPSVFAQTSSTTSDNSQTNQQSAPSNGQPTDKKNATKLQTVTVTGSMIPRVEVEGPAPVVSLTGEQIKAQGFTTLWEFLDSLPQVGQQSSDPAAWGSSSVNARSVNLRNVGPGFSLLLIDGHRVVDYPQPLNKQSNFQNYNNIPTGMIDHVEILASGASSIYGSDAVAGVINVILKKNYQGDELQVTGGGATRGGRAYGDINFFGGKSGENWHVLYNLEKSNRTALWGSDRPYQDSVADAGPGSWSPASRMFGYQYDAQGAIALSATNASGQYITPPAGTCGKFTNSQLSHSYSTTTTGTQVTGVTDNGYYCSQPALFQNWVLTPGSINNNAYVAGEYDFKDSSLQLYGSAALYDTTGISNTQLPVEVTGQFYDQSTGQVINQAIRQLTAQEMGSTANTHDREQNWNIQTGLRGSFDDSRFNWDVNLNTQKYTVREDYTGIDVNAMNNFFLGKQLGTSAGGLPVYAMNWQQWWNPITPQQYGQFAVSGENTSSSWLDQVQARINGDLYKLPWVDEPIGWAAVLEAAHNGFLLSPDARGDNNNFQNPFGAYLTGGGTRQRYSFGNEFRVPVLDSVTWTISGRLDKYHDASRADVARTWGTGLEWRPYDGLLIRGSYGTNFKAPDMQAIYLTGSTSPIGDYVDPLQCINAIKAGQSNSTWCSQVQRATSQYYNLTTEGSRLLQPQTGHSWTYGFVWQVPGVQGLSFSADYWHMGVDNAIQYLDPGTVLVDEAGCLTGLQVNGSSALSPYTAHVPGSAYCKMVTQMVQRVNGNGQIISEESGPINEASLYVSGVDASLDYKVQTENWGNFTANINYTDNLEYKQRVLASDELQNTRYNNVASRITWIGDWHKGDWDVSISGVRDGGMRAPNYGSCNTLPNGVQPSMITVQSGTETVATGVCQVTVNGTNVTVNDTEYTGHTPVWITWNTSVGWQINPDTKLKFTVSNIFDRVSSIPYYAGGFEFVTTGQTGSEYNGREMFLTFDYKLD
ncbi:membrane protein [Dyella lipolytica]|uniref:TonB-dependent receptor n=1 Tax=Dyella lipolytica TaxID=1867835 RepID=A0ABW8IY19_9GAMM|nr:TonB-dependent receptor [Dyella lipolytica]GLQ45875.1 membrane protein [Dyella lipolytica]